MPVANAAINVLAEIRSEDIRLLPAVPRGIRCVLSASFYSCRPPRRLLYLQGGNGLLDAETSDAIRVLPFECLNSSNEPSEGICAF